MNTQLNKQDSMSALVRIEYNEDMQTHDTDRELWETANGQDSTAEDIQPLATLPSGQKVTNVLDYQLNGNKGENLSFDVEIEIDNGDILYGVLNGSNVRTLAFDGLKRPYMADSVKFDWQTFVESTEYSGLQMRYERERANGNHSRAVANLYA